MSDLMRDQGQILKPVVRDICDQTERRLKLAIAIDGSASEPGNARSRGVGTRYRLTRGVDDASKILREHQCTAMTGQTSEDQNAIKILN